MTLWRVGVPTIFQVTMNQMAMKSDDNQYLVDYGQASTPFGEFTDLSSGRLHSCGITKLKALVCWGSNSDGQASTELIQ